MAGGWVDHVLGNIDAKALKRLEDPDRDYIRDLKARRGGGDRKLTALDTERVARVAKALGIPKKPAVGSKSDAE